MRSMQVVKSSKQGVKRLFKIILPSWCMNELFESDADEIVPVLEYAVNTERCDPVNF